MVVAMRVYWEARCSEMNQGRMVGHLVWFFLSFHYCIPAAI